MQTELSNWLDNLEKKHPVQWAQLPDIGLYMDQVMTYIDRQLNLYQQPDSNQEHILTAAMINNYIKDQLVPRADKKKYAPEHLARLTLIGALKQVLSMQDLQTLLGGADGSEGINALYDRFLSGQNLAVQDTVRKVSEQVSTELTKGMEADEVKRRLRDLSLDLAIEARIRILISEQVLNLLDQQQQAQDKKKLEADLAARAAKSKSKKGKTSEASLG